MEVVSIRLESDNWEPGSWDPQNTNVDVFVKLDDGSEWVASFFTYANIASPTDKNRRTGEYLSGRYFWASDMVLVDTVTHERVAQVVDELIAELEFESAFDKCDVRSEEDPCV
jgi:hypothetical protein